MSEQATPNETNTVPAETAAATPAAAVAEAGAAAGTPVGETPGPANFITPERTPCEKVVYDLSKRMGISEASVKTRMDEVAKAQAQGFGKSMGTALDELVAKGAKELHKVLAHNPAEMAQALASDKPAA